VEVADKDKEQKLVITTVNGFIVLAPAVQFHFSFVAALLK
jgi:hypothetical protein